MAAAGYSATPLVRKLGLRDGHRVLVLGRPATVDLVDVWQPWPDFAALQQRATSRSAAFDVVIAFCLDRTAPGRIGRGRRRCEGMCVRCRVERIEAGLPTEGPR
jgi:hypothetical protein